MTIFEQKSKILTKNCPACYVTSVDQIIGNKLDYFEWNADFVVIFFRLWDAVGGFLFLFANMQDKLSKHSSQVDLLKELLNLQKDMVIMMLSMLEGSIIIHLILSFNLFHHWNSLFQSVTIITINYVCNQVWNHRNIIYRVWYHEFVVKILLF